MVRRLLITAPALVLLGLSPAARADHWHDPQISVGINLNWGGPSYYHSHRYVPAPRYGWYAPPPRYYFVPPGHARHGKGHWRDDRHDHRGHRRHRH